MASIWRAYLRVLDKHPLKTQALMTGVIMGAGDTTAQLLIEKRRYDLSRTLKFAGLGVFYIAPTLRTWYILLDRSFGATGKVATVKKVALDQFAFAPFFLGSIMTGISLMQTQSLETTRQKLKQDYYDALLANWMVWPAFQLFNFYVIPFQHRIMAVNVVAFFWNTYLAWIANKAVVVVVTNSKDN